MYFSGCDIPFSQSVRNLGFYLDETLSILVQHFVLPFAQNWKKICSFLSNDAVNELAVSLILSRLDYCNSLFAGIPENKPNKLLAYTKSCSPTCPR